MAPAAPPLEERRRVKSFEMEPRLPVELLLRNEPPKKLERFFFAPSSTSTSAIIARLRMCTGGRGPGAPSLTVGVVAVCKSKQKLSYYRSVVPEEVHNSVN